MCKLRAVKLGLASTFNFASFLLFGQLFYVKNNGNLQLRLTHVGNKCNLVWWFVEALDFVVPSTFEFQKMFILFEAHNVCK